MIITHRVQLPSLLKHLNLPLIGVECGTADGGSAVDFMENGLQKLYCVDVWNCIPDQKGDAANSVEWHLRNLEVAKKRLKHYGTNVQFLRGLTSEMAWMVPDNSIGLLYLDGDHSAIGVQTDLDCYFDKVVDGGIIAGHDFLEISYGVRSVVTEFCKKRKYELFLIPENKPEDAGFLFVKN